VAAAQASADGADTGAPAVLLPVDWPGGGGSGGGSSGWFASEPRVLREVAGRIRQLAADSHAEPAGDSHAEPAWSRWHQFGALGDIRELGAETGLWATGRLVQHVHAQLQLGVTEFYGALVAGLPAVAARLEISAATYDTADWDSSRRIDQAGAGGTSGAADRAPSVVGPDGRF